MNPELAKKMLEVIAGGDEKAALALLVELAASMASGGEPPAAEAEALADNPEPPPADEQKIAASVAAYLRQLTGTKTDAEAAQAFSTVCTQIQSFGADRAAFELTERRTLIAELVKLEKETPATAWSGEPEKQIPCKRLASEPIGELRERVKALSALPPRGVTPPESGGEETVQLSKVEQEYCTKHSLTPEQFAARKASVVRKAQ